MYLFHFIDEEGHVLFPEGSYTNKDTDMHSVNPII
jgi:hypothetical protein